MRRKKPKGPFVDSTIFKAIKLKTVIAKDFCPYCTSMVKSKRKGHLKVCSECGARID